MKNENAMQTDSDDIVSPLRIPSKERGCEGKIQLGHKYQPQADRMSRKHGKSFGVYRCPHCDGTHLTTKIGNHSQYEPLIYVSGSNVDVDASVPSPISDTLKPQ